MAAPVSVTFGKRLPGKTRVGSAAFYRKGATISARAGMANIVAQYSDFIKALDSATPDMVMRAMKPAYDLSQRYVPKDTRALARSGKLEANSEGGADITYGDDTAWYAALVHEYTWVHHKNPTRSKYLQAAMEESFDSFLTSLAVDYAQFF